MPSKRFLKIKSLADLYELLPEEETILLDILRQIISENLPEYCKEKISYNVPYFYGNKGICLVWPASIPRGGIAKGVLLGFWYGKLLKDENNYLDKGNNKRIYYKIFQSPDDIDEEMIVNLIQEAVSIDQGWKSAKK